MRDRISVCIEWLYAEASSAQDRIRLAARDGTKGIEFWKWSTKNVDALAEAAKETQVTVTAILAEPMISLVDRGNHEDFLQGLDRSIAVARKLDAGILLVTSGAQIPEGSRDFQHRAVTDVLRRAADHLAGTGIRIGLEPLNSLVDHAGTYLDSTREALEIIREVDRREIGLTYDIYHSLVMGERAEEVLAGSVDRVVHVHVADHPGRNEPGTGKLPISETIAWLRSQGYSGWVGLEYKPTMASSESIAHALKGLAHP